MGSCGAERPDHRQSQQSTGKADTGLPDVLLRRRRAPRSRSSRNLNPYVITVSKKPRRGITRTNKKGPRGGGTPGGQQSEQESTLSMTSKSNAQNAARPVEPIEKPYATIYLSEELRRLKPGIIKTYAAIVSCSYVDKQTGQRISKATIRDIAQQGGISTDTARRNLAYLIDNTGLVSIGETETGRILMIETGDGPWVNLANDHPAWILSPLDFTVYLCLMRFNGPKGIIVSDATISELLFTSTKNVEKSMHALRGMGAIASTCWFKRTGSTVVKNRRVTIQSRTRWKISAVDPVESEPQKVGDKYIIPTFCGTESEPQKVGDKYIIPTFCGTESEPQKVGDGAAKSRITLPQKVGIDIELRDIKHTHTAHARTHEAEHQAQAGVCVLENSSGEPKAKAQKSSAERFFENIKPDLHSKVKRDIDRIEIENTIIQAWNRHGFLPKKFVTDCFTRVNDKTLFPVQAIQNALDKWNDFSQIQRQKLMSESEKTARNKGFWPLTEEQQELLNNLPESVQARLQKDSSLIEQIHTVWWADFAKVEQAINSPEFNSPETLAQADQHEDDDELPVPMPPKRPKRTPEEEKNEEIEQLERDYKSELEKSLSKFTNEKTKDVKDYGQLKEMRKQEEPKIRKLLDKKYAPMRQEIESKYSTAKQVTDSEMREAQ